MSEILVAGLTFPEAPRWRDGKLWFSDFYSQRVLTVDLADRLETVVEIPQRPSGLGWRPDGTLLVVSMLDRRLLRVEGGKTHVVADLSSLATGPCNDMVVDAAGRAYVGNFGFDRHRGEAERPTCLARVDLDGRVTRVAEDLHFPNGTVITPDGGTLIVAETLAHRLSAFDIGADGTLSNRRVHAALGDCFPTASVSTRRAPCGWPTLAGTACCACAPTARSIARWSPDRMAPTRACSAVRIGTRSSC
jgi:sugar lactone lactonase YvrE